MVEHVRCIILDHEAKTQVHPAPTEEDRAASAAVEEAPASV